VNEDARLDVLVASSIKDFASAVLNVGGSPIATWEDLGSGLAGTSGTPILSGIGSLVPGSHGALKLGHAAPSAPAVLFVSLTSTPTPFKCAASCRCRCSVSSCCRPARRALSGSDGPRGRRPSRA
jgi:hypothetical protein